MILILIKITDRNQQLHTVWIWD